MSFQPDPRIVLTHFNWSLARLKESIEKDDTEYYRGAALNRFKLTYEVAIKTIRTFAKEQGQICSTEESCFQWIKEKKWLGKNAQWNNILADYQRVENGLGDNEVDKIYGEMQKYYTLLKHISECMKLVEE